MANEMPNPNSYQGLSKKVLQYSEAFRSLAQKLKQPGFSDSEWAEIEALVDVAHFEREGVFLTQTSEVIDWPKYKHYVTQYAGATEWEGTLRRITEKDNVVFLELQERNTRAGVVDISNTVTIYDFNDAGKLRHLSVYVSHVGKKGA